MREVQTTVSGRELNYYEDFYSGEAQRHFAKPAVVAFRRHLAGRILTAAQLGPDSRVLSVGCGVGDTELLLAPHIGEITGVDLSPCAIEQANRDAGARGIHNARFHVAAWQDFAAAGSRFDAVLAIFFLHHLDARDLEQAPAQLRSLLAPGGRVYALDPSARRLSGAVGRLIVPKLMAKYQTKDERPLDPAALAEIFTRGGFNTKTCWYDFVSTPLAGLFPSVPLLYRAGRIADEALTRIPLLRALSSNFELLAVSNRRL